MIVYFFARYLNSFSLTKLILSTYYNKFEQEHRTARPVFHVAGTRRRSPGVWNLSIVDQVSAIAPSTGPLRQAIWSRQDAGRKSKDATIWNVTCAGRGDAARKRRDRKRHIFTGELKNDLNQRKPAAVSDTLKVIWCIAHKLYIVMLVDRRSRFLITGNSKTKNPAEVTQVIASMIRGFREGCYEALP